MKKDKDKLASKGVIVDQLDYNAHKIVENTIKIVVYHDIKHEYVNQWISEIASVIADCDDIVVKGNKKLTSADFRVSLFKWISDADSDYRRSLNYFKEDNLKGKFSYEVEDTYPDFQITAELRKKVKVACLDIVDRTIPLLCDKVNHHKGEYELELKDVFKFYV